MIAKVVIQLPKHGEPTEAAIRIGLDFGTRYRRAGWGSGLTILGCMANLIPFLEGGVHTRAIYHGATVVVADTDGHASRFLLNPLPTTVPISRP